MFPFSNTYLPITGTAEALRMSPLPNRNISNGGALETSRICPLSNVSLPNRGATETNRSTLPVPGSTARVGGKIIPANFHFEYLYHLSRAIQNYALSVNITPLYLVK